MKKKYLTYAGIVSAIILVVMFAIILLTGFFAIFSTATIDPIPDYAPGNLVVITGTTNLMAGTMLELDIVNLSSSSGTYSRVGGVDAFIVRGGGIANSWSGVLDTSSLPPGEYQVNAYATNGTGSRSNLLATARLRLTITAPNQNKIIYNFTSQGPVAGPCNVIMIDTLAGTLTNQTYTVTGTTSLSPGAQLLLEVFPAEIDVNVNMGTAGMSGSMSGASDDVEVVRGTGNTNIWSADLDLSRLPPDEYLVNVSNDRIDNRTYSKIYGDTYCSQRFTLSG
ncbi:MAG: hypothetical protein WAK75_06635 [Methanoregula sp.]|uniref:hypothetical protein n=1 Tax=Methanoregula sp. TaxID=2052170 RepID=UPI003BAF0517